MTDLTPLAKRLTDRAFNHLEAVARDQGEPGFEYADIQHAVAAVLRELVACDVYRGEADFERVADELDGEPVAEWHLESERKRWMPQEKITTADGHTYPLVSTPGAKAHKDGALIYEDGQFVDEPPQQP